MLVATAFFMFHSPWMPSAPVDPVVSMPVLDMLNAPGSGGPPAAAPLPPTIQPPSSIAPPPSYPAGAPPPMAPPPQAGLSRPGGPAKPPTCSSLLNLLNEYELDIQAIWTVDEIFLVQWVQFANAENAARNKPFPIHLREGFNEVQSMSLNDIVNTWCMNRYGVDPTEYALRSGGPALNPITQWLPSLPDGSPLCDFGQLIPNYETLSKTPCSAKFIGDLELCRKAFKRGGMYYPTIISIACETQNYQSHLREWALHADGDTKKAAENSLALISMWTTAKRGSFIEPNGLAPAMHQIWMEQFMPQARLIGNLTSVKCPMRLGPAAEH